MPPKRSPLYSDFYTAAQVKKILGITDGMLYNYVNNGTLERVIPPGRKQGVYRKKDVDMLAAELQAFIIQRKNKSTKFARVTTEEEMRECQEISQELFGVGRDTVKERMKILSKNPDTYHMLIDEDLQQIVGYVAMIPLKTGKLAEVLSQQIPVRINPDDILDTTQSDQAPQKIDLYLHAMGVKPGFNLTDKRLYGSRLISGLVNIIIEMGKKGIEIETIAARSNMPDGVRLMKHAGFTEIEPLTPERRTFIIDVKTSGIPFILQYKRALAEGKS
ncbi:hypothetical protein EI42_04809 [Thermosporothrix hazakensis]|uniref:Uncharacterized protein n=2 Tax=Thermosporothrix hazakensis TaxID=644383 RepID=A0A326U0G7_THEHA|nr:hypothetical protein EI42_04809 [Thermosporothrix hazakensis]GCE48510.1 hypothetical protein KTH_33790 [Thermosporothrix hazakensis]